MSTELDELLGKRVALKAEGGWISGDFQGKLISYSNNGLALEETDGVIVIDLSSIVDIHEVSPITKIVRRVLRIIPPSQARQHLVDRHAVPWSLVKIMTPETAHEIHAKMVHTDLGHRHREEDKS